MGISSLHTRIQDAARHGIAELPLALQGFDELANGLRSSGDVQGNQGELNDGLGWSKDLLDVILMLHAVASTHGGEVPADPSDLVLRFGVILKDIVEAQQHHDQLLLADILEYELQPFLAEAAQPRLHQLAELAIGSQQTAAAC